MTFVPTFYVDFHGGKWHCTCHNSDSPMGSVLLSTSWNKYDVVSKGKKKYFGSVKSTDKVKVVWVSK